MVLIFSFFHVDIFFAETLRKYPVLPMINRTCVNEYKIPGTDKVIEKGTEIYISVLGLHRDGHFYSKPDEFNPVRLSEKMTAGKNLLNHPYIPFGDGPRNCIGMRLGKMQTKVGLISMLHKFKYDLDDELKKGDIEFDPRHFLLQPRNDIFLHVSKR